MAQALVPLGTAAATTISLFAGTPATVMVSMAGTVVAFTATLAAKAPSLVKLRV